MNTMKKYSILLSAAFAIFALASCQKEQETAEQNVTPDVPSSIPFQLRAEIPTIDTKTTLNTSTWAVNWESTDIIYAVTTDEVWGVAYKDDNAGDTIADFAYDSGTGTFSTSLAIADGSHTFNFLYSGNAQRSYHRGASTTFQLAGTQTFDASAPTANLKTYDALAAQVAATTPTTFADVQMSHLFSLMKVTLKNKTGADVTLTKFEIEIPGQDLYGIFDVTFGATPSAAFSKNGGDKITVNISNGTVANNGSLDVYFVMGPVTGYTGEVTFTVTDGGGNTYSKTNTITAPGVTFAAGTYNTANYTIKTPVVDYVTLDWDYAGGTSADLNAVVGVTTSGLGSDYGDTHAPNQVKFDTNGDYIQVKTDAAISTVSVGYKMVGGNATSHLYIYESVDGSVWGEKIDDLTISGATNSTGTVTTTADFNSSSRFVKIEFKKGSNVGIGTISIHKANTDPAILASDIANVPAAGVTDADWTYTVKNFVDDVEVAEVTGCVSEAIADAGDIVYSVTPNYTTTAKEGTIVLWSAADHSVTKTINVAQLKSTLTVSALTVTIPASSTTATFTVTTAEFGYNAVVASTEAGMNLSISSGASGSANVSAQTVTVSSTTDAPTSGDPITLGTISVYRNGNTSDTQKKTITIKKAVNSGSGSGPAAGTVLWTDTFGTSWGATTTTFTDQALLSTYDYAGRTGYSDNTDVTLTADSNNVRGTKSSGGNCSGSHLWFNKSTNGTVTTSAIRLYGATSLVLTYDQGTSGSSLTAGYSTDGGSSWTNFDASSAAANVERTFTVEPGTTSVILRFVHSSSNAKNTRFDNPKLAVGD